MIVASEPYAFTFSVDSYPSPDLPAEQLLLFLPQSIADDVQHVNIDAQLATELIASPAAVAFYYNPN
jgi:hypothetical protein